MKLGWLALSALVLGGVAAKPAAAQISAYADFSASKMTNPTASTFAMGPTFGVQGQVTSGKRVKLYGDVRGFYYTGGNVQLGKNNLTFTGVSVGPKVSIQVKRFEPYAEGLVGFARYNDGNGNAASGTTDAQLEFNSGVDYRVTKRFDWRVAEFGYKQFYGDGGQFNPKTFSTGIVYHLTAR